MVDVQKYEEGRRLHPSTLVQRFILSVPAIALLMLPLIRRGSGDANVYLVLLYIFVIVTSTIPPIVIRYIRFRYWINPKEVVIRSGVFTVQHRNIPIERVQNIAIERSLLARILGIAKVSIETAGSGTTEGSLEYVSREEAEEIRAVVQRFKRLAEEASDDPPPHEESQPEVEDGAEVLFQMNSDRVLLTGVFRLSLLYIALFFSGIQYLGIDGEDLADWVLGHQFEVVDMLSGLPTFLLAVVSVFLIVILSWITGIIVNFNRFHGFRLSLEDGKLQMRHGLLTVADRTVPRKRVQALAIRTNPLMKSFGWYRLEIQTMGTEGDAGGRTVVVPLARWTEIMSILPHIADVEHEVDIERVSRITIRRTAIRLSLSLAVIVGILWLIWSDSWWLLALLPFAIYYAICHYRIHGFGVSSDSLVVRRGVFLETYWILPAAKFQVFYETSSIFQRRLGLRSLLVDMAGSNASGSAFIVDLPHDRATDLGNEIDQIFRIAGERLRSERRIKADASIDLHPRESHNP